MQPTENTAIQSVLAEVLGSNQVLQRGSEEYEENNGSYFSAFENEVKPAFIAKPMSVQEVCKLIRSLRPLLLSGAIHIAVRGTGHTPFAGSANIQDGVTIDMRGIKGISLSENKEIVSIGAGETWSSVYTELEKHGLTVAGGRQGQVGVTGLVLGGGLSLYSTRRGFACDSVTEFEVVLASGEIVHASAQENQDLWISLRGGLNNFGIVTSFKMNTFESGNIWGGHIFVLPDAYPKLLKAIYDFATNDGDHDTHIICGAAFGHGHQVGTCLIYHTKGQENPPVFQPFTSIEPQIQQMNTLRTGTHLEFCNELTKTATNGLRQYYATCTIRPDLALMEQFHDKFLAALSKIKDVEGLIFPYGFQALTKTLLESSAAAGGNAKDISPSDGPLLIVFISPTWKLAEDDARVIDAIQTFLEELKRLASERGLLHRYIFTNYAYEKENVLKGYGEESLAKMKAVSKKFDPEGIFQTAVPGGFKLEK